ncbi:retrotransposable element Tf2 [Tanacetum coccineum]
MVGTRGTLTNGANPTNNSALDDQTKAFIQQLVDSAMAGIQSSFQESISQLMIQQGYLTADVNRLKNGEGTSNRLQFGRITKLEFPKFTGVDVKNWLYKCQQFFSVENVDDADKVKLASIHFFDSALVWHQQYEKINGTTVSWEDYQKAVLARFDTEFEDPLSELKNLKCDSNVQKYHEKFELLLNKVEMPEAHAISLFLGGMPQSISLPVRMFKPKSLSDTTSLCKLQEATIAAHKARQSPILPKPNTGYGSFGNRGGYVAPRNQTTPLALPAPKANIVNPTRKYLSQKEFDEKRTKGLCFHYDQKFVPGHKCSGQAFALELVIDPEPEMEMYAMERTEEEFVMPEVTNDEIVTPPKLDCSGMPLGVLLHSIKYKLQ